MPGLVRGVLLSIFVILFVYAFTRYWVWEHKSWKNVIVYIFFVFPVMYGFVALLGVILFLLSLLTITKTGFVQDLSKVLASLAWLTIVSVWTPYLTARCAQGKNPWYSMYDAVKDMWSKRSLQILLVYTVPIIYFILSMIVGWNLLGSVPVFWVAYLFARQYIMSKKHSVRAYLTSLGHYYAKKR